MKIYMWGTGRLAGKVIGKYIDADAIEGFVDNAREKEIYMGKKVISPQELRDTEYDAILVANLFSIEIYNQCVDLEIDLNRVIFLYQNCIMQDLNRNYMLAEKIIGTKYADIVKNRYYLVRGVETREELCLSNHLSVKEYQKNDYVRLKSFELAVQEIRKKGIEGATAEAGVFRGEFAQFMNQAFPDRKLYLFDTFKGFDSDEARKEIRNNNCTEAFVKAYEHTNVGLVLSKMNYPDKVIIKKGRFPDSLDNLEEIFAFVSLDMDFEESIYAGLQYFYPRLSQGGYIFVHDYNSDLFGVQSAVDRYEKEEGISLCKVPLCDANGTLVITK